MARPKLRTIKKASSPSVRLERSSSSSFSDRLNLDLSDRRSTINLLLGALVVLALGILLYNYFTKNNNQADLGPAQQTENTQTQASDVAKQNLPGKYTVKEGDTLFIIAQKYYDDGYKFSELVKANKLANENVLEVGQVLDIPKLDTAVAQASTTPTPVETPAAVTQQNMPSTDQAKGGATNQTIWGETITGTNYTVRPDDWLSKIAGRAYGDVMMFQKIAQANNISNPDLIEPGMVLKIPR